MGPSFLQAPFDIKPGGPWIPDRYYKLDFRFLFRSNIAAILSPVVVQQFGNPLKPRQK